MIEMLLKSLCVRI